MAKTLSQQLRVIRCKGSRKPAESVKFGILILAIGLGIGAIVKTDMALLAMSFVCGLFAVLAFQSGPYPAYAARAIQSGRRIRQAAKISVEVLFEQNRYYVTTQDLEKREWKFEFVPRGWRPAPGETPVEAYHLDGLPCPALLVAKHGIMIPRFKPKPVAQHVISYGRRWMPPLECDE